jgi:hypothetical protein
VLTFLGSVSSVDLAGGVVTVEVTASDSLGDHAVATVKLTVPSSRAS